jgi:hypothetical protein
VSATRDLIVVRGSVNAATAAFAATGSALSVVGQSAGTIAGATPGFHLTAGSAYLRDLKLQTGGSVGCQADTGTTLTLNHLTVTANSGGGILLDGAAFDIRNTTVTTNGPGQFGAVTWGGIFANNPPAAGPKQLQLVTVQSNNPIGVSCSAMIQGTGVLASGNSVDIATTCMFSSCGTANATCGAQP